MLMVLFMFLFGVDDNKGRQIALVITVSKFQYFDNLPANINDGKIIRETLINKGFLPENIYWYNDTINAITVKDVRTYLTIFKKKLKKQDRVLIYFSTHGQQLSDDNGDEEVDKLDEALVFFDSCMEITCVQNKSKYNKHLRDDEFGIYLNSIKNIIGDNGSLISVVDACHSESFMRASEQEEVKGGYLALRYLSIDKVQVSSQEMPKAASLLETKDTSNVVLMSAARSNEPARYINVNGVKYSHFTYAFIEAWKNYSSKVSALEVYNSLSTQFIYDQHPTLEGNTKLYLPFR